MTYEEIKALVTEQYNDTKKRRMKIGMTEHSADREAHLIVFGMLKAFYKVRAITDEQFSDLICEF